MDKNERKRELVLQASDLVTAYDKLKKDTESPPSLKKLVAKYLKAEIYNIKKELEEIEDGQR